MHEYTVIKLIPAQYHYSSNTIAQYSHHTTTIVTCSILKTVPLSEKCFMTLYAVACSHVGVYYPGHVRDSKLTFLLLCGLGRGGGWVFIYVVWFPCWFAVS